LKDEGRIERKKEREDKGSMASKWGFGKREDVFLQTEVRSEERGNLVTSDQNLGSARGKVNGSKIITANGRKKD
jgi:hypothetical protein